MRLIYLVRAAQLLVTLRALAMLYSVSEFCERQQLPMKSCPATTARPPFVTPEQMPEHERVKTQRPAANRGGKTTSSSSTEATATPTAHASPNTESSVVASTVTSSEGTRSRKKRDERKELPDNGATEARRKTGADEAKEEKKVEVTTPIHATEKTVEERKEEKKPDHPSTTTTQSTTEVKKESIETTTEVGKEEVKEHKGDKVQVEIPTTSQPEKDHHQAPSASSEEKKQEDEHHTVKKELKAHHVPEPLEVVKEVTPNFPALPPAQVKFVLEHSDAFLHQVRCLELTSDGFFGRENSPFAPHLKGLCVAGPVLVVICIYLVCTVLRTGLSNEPSSEITHLLGGFFHVGMWLVVDLSMYFICDHWAGNWKTASNHTFAPEFPCCWSNLIFVSAFMMVAASVEMWFNKYLHYDVVLERSYRCYEIIDNPSFTGESSFKRTDVD